MKEWILSSEGAGPATRPNKFEGKRTSRSKGRIYTSKGRDGSVSPDSKLRKQGH